MSRHRRQRRLGRISQRSAPELLGRRRPRFFGHVHVDVDVDIEVIVDGHFGAMG
jgi:hypothetical protein